MLCYLPFQKISQFLQCQGFITAKNDTGTNTFSKNWIGCRHYADLPDAAALLEILPGESREVILTGGLEPVWNKLWACILLVALLTGEWICRMRMRLL